MVNDAHKGNDQIRVPVGDNIYYGCCQNCVGKLQNNENYRFAQDPVTDNIVDKSKAYIVLKPGSLVLWVQGKFCLVFRSGPIDKVKQFLHQRKIMKYQKKTLRYFLLPSILMLLSLSACNRNASEKKEAIGTSETVEKKRAEVMAVHDELMPRMGTLMNLKKKLRERVAAMDSSQTADKGQIGSIRASIGQLEVANEAMMQWMRTYKDPADSVSKQDAMEYLDLKEQEILQVKGKIQESEANAKALLNKNLNAN